MLFHIYHANKKLRGRKKSGIALFFSMLSVFTTSPSLGSKPHIFPGLSLFAGISIEAFDIPPHIPLQVQLDFIFPNSVPAYPSMHSYILPTYLLIFFQGGLALFLFSIQLIFFAALQEKNVEVITVSLESRTNHGSDH